MTIIRNLLLLVLLATTSQVYAAEKERWYSDAQVAQGEQVFRQNCSVCHGQDAEATPNWKQTDANGNYPPPPLNGTAHAWHHELNILRRTIREGGRKLGGVMPGFEDKFNAAQIDSVIAFFQSKWPDDIYQRWANRFGSSALPSLDYIALAANRDTIALTAHDK